ncbi:MAG: MFS transporter [Chloroflexi bacterium]|nr:MFS transporter [Chloroflexota bacterium]
MPIFAEREKKSRAKNPVPAQTENKPIPFLPLPPTPELTFAERQEGQKRMVHEGMLFSIMNNSIVPGGAVLTAFALYMGADVFIIGLITALPLFSTILQLWTPQFISKVGNRKKLTVLTMGSARASLIPLTIIGLGAWYGPNLAGLWLILFLLQLTIYSGLTAIGSTSWLSWAMTVVPIEQRATYFAKRATLVGMVGLVAALFTGFFLDWWTEPAATATGHRTNPGAYVVLFAIAAVMGLTTTWLLHRTPDLKNEPHPAERPSFKESLRSTWAMVALRKYLIFRSVQLFAIGTVVPYYTVYMLENLKMSFTELFFLQNVGALAGLVVFPLWGRVLEKYGNSPVLFWTSWAKIAYVVLWAFVVPGNPFWPLLFLFISLAIDSGFNLAAGNLLMNLLPTGTGNVGYISVFTAVSSVATAIGPFLAGIVIGWIASTAVPIFGFEMGAIQIMFLASGVLRVISMFFFHGFSDAVKR